MLTEGLQFFTKNLLSLQFLNKPQVRFLEKLIVRAHRLRIFGRQYHPYFLATDCAILASLAAIYVMTRHFKEVSFLGYVAVFGLMFALYELFLRFKRRVFNVSSRSFLQDTVLFLLPTYVLVSVVVGYPLRLALDLAGLVFPIFGCCARIGCFFGGCCYGIPWDKGVLYPNAIFVPVRGRRNFTPGDDPHTRVLPIQLFESAGLLGISVLVFSILWWEPEPRGIALPLFLLCYCALRFVLDFFRTSSARPRIGPFSEAQVYSIVVAAFSAVALARLAPFS